jgi:hypothetical protein
MRTRGNWRSRNPTLANVLAAAIAACPVGFGAYGVLRDDLVVPPSRYGHSAATGHYYHFHGAAAWLVFAGLVCLGSSIVLAISRRPKAKPSGKTDQRVALIMSMAGISIILTMMILKWVDLA